MIEKVPWLTSGLLGNDLKYHYWKVLSDYLQTSQLSLYCSSVMKSNSVCHFYSKYRVPDQAPAAQVVITSLASFHRDY